MTATLQRYHAISLIAAIAVAGCGGRSLSPAGALVDGAGAVDSAGGGFAGSGASTAAGGFVSTAIGQSSQSYGLVSAVQSNAGPNAFNYLLTAAFYANGGPWDGCTREQLDYCSYYECPVGAPSKSPPLLDAGRVFATAGSNQIPIPRLGSSYAVMGSAELWSPLGGLITFSGEGSSVVPSFILTSLTPPTVSLTAFNGGEAPATLARSAGIKLQWTTVGAGNVNFELDQIAPQGKRPAAVCQFLSMDKAGEFSSAVLSRLEPGFYTWHFEGWDGTQTDVETWHIDANTLSFDSVVTGQEIELQ